MSWILANSHFDAIMVELINDAIYHLIGYIQK